MQHFGYDCDSNNKFLGISLMILGVFLFCA